ncbi:hypothetical protein [Ferruginibacter sp.]|nr:hypothetical protein [Ferruginibacter sp.]
MISIFKDIEIKEFDSSKTSKNYLVLYHGRIFEINSLVKSVVEYVKQGKTENEIAETISKNENISLTENHIQQIKENIIQKISSDNENSIVDSIYFKIKFISPKVVKVISSCLTFFFNKFIFIFLNILFVLVFILIAPIIFAKSDLSNPNNFFPSILLTTSMILFHEIGHSTAIEKFNLKQEAIGFGFYFFSPVFYTNSTQAWMLDRKRRLIIDYGGIYFQTLLLIPLGIYFYFSKDLLVKNIITYNYIIIYLNLNPFLKFDGYWIFSDLIGVPNLRQKSSGFLLKLFQKYFLRKNIQLSFLEGLKKPVRYAFLFYVIIVNIFFGYFIFYLLPFFLVSFANEVIHNFSAFQESLVSLIMFKNLWLNANIFFSYIIKCGLILFYIIFLWKLLIRVYVLLKVNFKVK